MKKTITWVFMLYVVVSFSRSSFAEETIRITNGEWDPFLSENLQHYGVISHIVTEAFALEGVNVEYGFFPWGRAYEFVKFGDWDGSVVWTHTPDREKDVYFSDPLLVSNDVFFHLKRYTFDWNTIEDLKDIDIGATIGYTYGKAFDNAEKFGEIRVERVPTDDINFRKLLVGRIQIFPMNIDVGYSLMHEKFTLKEARLITNHLKPIGTYVYHLLLSKKVERNKQMLILFNKGLKRLKESGRYDQYFEDSRRGKYLIK